MTLGTHVDPDLERATAAAARALRDRLDAAGWGDHWPAVIEAAPILADIAIGAAWADLKRATRRPTDDGR